jgi:hypothetical protein
MRAWPLHALFTMLLVASLVARERAGGDVLSEPADMEPAVIRLAQSLGLAYRGLAPLADSDARVLSFDARDCPRPVLIAVLAVSLEAAPVLAEVGAPGDHRRYVYFDQSWTSPERFALLRERAKLAALALAGLTRDVPSWHMLLIEAPQGCRAAEAIDWRPVWDRDYLASAQKEAVAPGQIRSE